MWPCVMSLLEYRPGQRINRVPIEKHNIKYNTIYTKYQPFARFLGMFTAFHTYKTFQCERTNTRTHTKQNPHVLGAHVSTDMHPFQQRRPRSRSNNERMLSEHRISYALRECVMCFCCIRFGARNSVLLSVESDVGQSICIVSKYVCVFVCVFCALDPLRSHHHHLAIVVVAFCVGLWLSRAFTIPSQLFLTCSSRRVSFLFYCRINLVVIFLLLCVCVSLSLNEQFNNGTDSFKVFFCTLFASRSVRDFNPPVQREKSSWFRWSTSRSLPTSS